MLVYIPICPVYHYCSYWTYMFNHLAADRASLAGGQIAVVALLEVDADLAGGFHLELVHSGLGSGMLSLLLFLLDIMIFSFSYNCFWFHLFERVLLFGYRKGSLTHKKSDMQFFCW